MLQIFADMEELGIKPSMPIVTMMGYVFKKIDMLDKYEKLMKKYPPQKWEYRYVRGKRIRVKTNYGEETEANGKVENSDRTNYSDETEPDSDVENSDVEASNDAVELHSDAEVSFDKSDEESNLYLPQST